jgi:hypothetical protein
MMVYGVVIAVVSLRYHRGLMGLFQLKKSQQDELERNG